LKLPEQWPLEFASVAAQPGHIALPERTLSRLHAGETLSPAESVQVAQSALVAERVLKRIPRLDPVVDILSRLAAGRITDDSRAPESIGAEIHHPHEVASSLLDLCEVVVVGADTIREAIRLAARYQLSHWDSLIVAAAMLAGCETLYSEDLQHNQLFEERLRIINPFAS
jgi:predicted nucleic acid-binding protein